MMVVRENGSGVRGELRVNEPMSRHTSWRAGGTARRWFRPADDHDLLDYLRGLPADEEICWVGLGSNLLVRDGGFPGTVIMTFGVLSELSRPEPLLVRAGAGVACAKVARFSALQGLTGNEFLAGIPGTMGGALAMNAGAFGGTTWERVVAVETIDRAGNRHTRYPDEYNIGYRHVEGPADEWFAAAIMRLEEGDTARTQQRIKELLAKRSRTQPTSQPSCGSVFRNPEGDFAARLVETAGLKGRCRGGACVSDMHANFIVNTGDATAADIEGLIEEVRTAVRDRHGVELELEVRIIGDAARAR